MDKIIRFRLNGNSICLHRFRIIFEPQIDHVEVEDEIIESVTETPDMYFVTLDEMIFATQIYNNEEQKFTVQEIDISGYEQYEGMTADNYDIGDAILNGTYVAPETIEKIASVGEIMTALNAAGVITETEAAQAQSAALDKAGVRPSDNGNMDWSPGKYLAKDTVIIYEGVQYSVIQPHISQSDWLPDKVPALYKKMANSGTGDILDWVQPTGAHDAYKKGDTVKYNGKTWQSEIDANVWKPGEYGWKEMRV